MTDLTWADVLIGCFGAIALTTAYWIGYWKGSLDTMREHQRRLRIKEATGEWPKG
jgi:hypothetical protein